MSASREAGDPRAAHGWSDLVWRRVASLAALLVMGACGSPPEPIAVENGTVVIENRTAREWRSLRVTVNDHYFGGSPVLAPGGRLHAPLSRFQTGFGEKFDQQRMTVQKVEVTAVDAEGNPVALKWEKREAGARTNSTR